MIDMRIGVDRLLVVTTVARLVRRVLIAAEKGSRGGAVSTCAPATSEGSDRWAKFKSTRIGEDWQDRHLLLRAETIQAFQPLRA